MICIKCKITKPQEEFTGSQKWCKICRKEYDRAYYEKNKTKRINQNSNLRERNKDFIRSFLQHKCCVNCGITDIRVLDFAHIDSTTKRFSITDAVRCSYSIETIRQEIKKCKVLCANCHRIETAEEFGSHRNIGA